MYRLVLCFLLFSLKVTGQYSNKLFDPVALFYNFNITCVADRLYYPVNHGSMIGYHDAQPFGGKYNHLGADINGNQSGNSDDGDTIYSIGKGKVIVWFEGNYGDGKNDCHAYIIQILHKTKYGYIVSQYRHCKEILIEPDQYVNEKQPIATMGTECGHFQSHLHFEIRLDPFLLIEGGYGDMTGFVDPIKYIKNFNND